MKNLLLSVILLSFIVSGLSFSPFLASPLLQANAQNQEAEELQRQIDERNDNIRKLEEEIAKYQAEADKTSAVAVTLSSKIKQLEATNRKLDTDIKLTQQKISAASLTINMLSNEITDKETRIINSRASIGENIRQLNQRDFVPIIQAFLSRKNIAETFNELHNLVLLQTNLREHITTLGGTRLALQKDRSSSEDEKDKLEEFQGNLTGQKTVLSVNRTEQSQLLTATKSQEAEYQRLVKERAAQKATLTKEIFEYESKLKYVLDPSSIPSKGSTPFVWPLDNIFITQQFGVTNASGRLYASGSHNGTDFRALTGTPIKAMGNGVVIGAGDTDLTCKGASFGRWTLIKYDSNLSAIFAHMSVVSVKEGDRVTTGQVVGYSGNTGYSTGPHLHVSVYPGDAVTVENRPSLSCGGKVYRMPIAAVNAYLDPLAYMPKL